MSDTELYCTEEQGERLSELVPSMFIVLDAGTRYPKLTKKELRHVMKHFNKDHPYDPVLMEEDDVSWWLSYARASGFAEAIIEKIEARL